MAAALAAAGATGLAFWLEVVRFARSGGALPQLEPLFPTENCGKIPAAIQASTEAMYQSSPEPPPQELFTTCGRRSGRGFSP